MATSDKTPRELLDTSLVALTLSGVCRLRQEFFAESSALRRTTLLTAASELMDRTVCNAELRGLLTEQFKREGPAADPLKLLVPHRDGVAVVPPQLWPAARTKVNDLGQAGYKGWRALTLALRQEVNDIDTTMAALDAWLAPAWAEHPELKGESLALPVAMRELDTMA